MEEATEMLEAKFKKAESDLNYLSRKLELRCQNDAQGDNRRNPTELLQKVEAMKKEYKALVQETAEIQKIQTEAMEYFRTQLPVAMQLLQHLQIRTTADGCEDTEKIEELVNQLGIKPPVVAAPAEPWQQTASSDQAVPSQQISAVADQQVSPSASAVSVSRDTSGSDTTCDAGLDDPVLARAALRASSTDFVDISQEELDSISELVRGRVKLSEVSAVYRILWKHFKEEYNSKPLSPSEMHKMGLRVSGATGKAKLRVLRALKLLSISTKDEVTLLS